MRRQLPVHSPLGPGQILSAALAALARGDDERAALRDELRRRFDAGSVILTGSGTHALQLVLQRLPSGGLQEVTVALPGYSCYDLVSAAVGASVRVRFYDIEPVSLTPDVDSLRAALREGVSAVVVGNLYGYPLNWTALRSECEAAGVPLIEDAAQGIGTITDEGPGGTLGDATVLSFGRGKGWTGGGGGALLLRGSAGDWISGSGISSVSDGRLDQASRFRGARSLAVTAAAWMLGRPGLYRIPTSIPGLGLGETHYREPTPPTDISSFSAGLARRTADDAREVVGVRRRRAERLAAGIRGSEGTRDRLRICEPVGGADAAAFLRLPLVADDFERARRILRAGPDLGFAAGYPRPLHRLPQAKALLARARRPHDRQEAVPTLHGSERLAACIVTLPTHRWVLPSEESAMCDAVVQGSEGTRTT